MSCAPDSECGCGAASCCEGADALVPEPIDNPPGQSSLRYRVGTYSSFFETMLARLVMPTELPGRCASDPPEDEPDPLGHAENWPLRRFTTRDTDDPTIALLDAWAMVGDVLTFYQERIANEGYLRTATDLRSVQELARLVGYRPRPGVAASAELAFTIEPGQTVEIPAGTKAQSLPTPGQLPAVFETMAPLRASAEWNAMPPLVAMFSVPKLVEEGTSEEEEGGTNGDEEGPLEEGLEPRFLGDVRRKKQTKTFLLEVYLEGMSTNLATNSVVIVLEQPVGAPGEVPPPPLVPTVENLYRVERVELKPDIQQTRVLLRGYGRLLSPPSEQPGGQPPVLDAGIFESVNALVGMFDRRALPVLALRRAARIDGQALRLTVGNERDGERDRGGAPPEVISFVNEALDEQTLTDRQLLEIVGGDRVMRDALRKALEDLKARREGATRFHAFRASSALFGYNAPISNILPSGEIRAWPIPGDETSRRLFVDAPNDRVRPGSFVVIDPGQKPPRDESGASDRQRITLVERVGGGDGESIDSEGGNDSDDAIGGGPLFHHPELSVSMVKEASIHPRTAYGISSNVLDLTLTTDWFQRRLIRTMPGDIPLVVRSTMTHIQSEQLRVARIPLGPLEGDRLDLQGLFFDLEPGRMVIIEGEDYDARGARRAERRFIQGVAHDIVEVSTCITLTKELQHRYVRRNTVIYGNVAVATQGESHIEILGSGDASQASQAFTLRHKPLTHVPAATVDGVASTLTVRVNGAAWPAEELQALLEPRDRKVATRTDEQGRTMVIGGDGWRGARFPTGLENIVAEYRSGQGPEGNVDPGKITNLPARPYGVQKVTNPVAASGGAGPDGLEAIRTRVALSVMALDRLVSVEDHERFALRFAGVVKASARLVPVKGVFGGRQVKVIIAGSEPRPLEPDSELVVRLREALHRFGDPSLAVAVEPAKLEAISIHVKLQVATGYVFREVEPRVRAALTKRLGYDEQGIGQAIHPSRIVTIIQEVAGVDFVDLDKIEAMGLTDEDPLDSVDQDPPPTEADDDLPDDDPPDNDRVILPGADTILFVDATRRETLDLQEWMP
jgi:hypothetical protein